jgi:hypothetical protein
MMRGVGVGAELQPAGAVPGVESLHLPTLDAACSQLCSRFIPNLVKALGQAGLRLGWFGERCDNRA